MEGDAVAATPVVEVGLEVVSSEVPELGDGVVSFGVTVVCTVGDGVSVLDCEVVWTAVVASGDVVTVVVVSGQ